MNTKQQTGSVKVWDGLIRLGHWILVAAFVTAYFSAEEFEDLHVIAGWVVAIYVLLRMIWGFIGSRHARFSDFVRGPRAVFGYLRGLADRSAPRTLGHNPAGGAMVIVLLLALAVTCASGLLAQGADEHEGPLAGWFTTPATTSAGDEKAEESGGEIYEEIHELTANLTVALIVLHVLGVIASSIVHRENLPLAMLSGRKRPLE